MLPVRRRPLPPLNTEVTELALGTWGLCGDGYGPVAQAESDAVIDRAIELGISLFDTADCYANGQMEQRLGRRLEQCASQALVATRIGTDRSGDRPRKLFDEAYLKEAVERSRQRLQRDRIDICMLHNPSIATIERGEATGVLKDLAERSVIGAWGVSAGDQHVALASIEAGAKVIALPYNLMRSRDLHAIAGEIAMRGVCLLAHSVLAYGLLAAHWGPDRTFDEGDHRADRWSPEELKQRVMQLGVVRQMVGGEVLTPRCAALRFVLSNALVTSAILGPRSTAQLDQLVREAGNGPPYLSDAVLAALPGRLSAAGIYS
jgi:aryl-alcohol dehydrogenase-like predicted oxidoreductase